MASRPEMVQVLTATASIFVAGAACFVAWQARKLAEMQVKQHPKLKQAIVVIGAGPLHQCDLVGQGSIWQGRSRRRVR